MPQLAEELLALIADIIADEGDNSTLSQLALVNRQLLTLVRERRIASLVIGGPDFHSQPPKLLEHLQILLSLIQNDSTFAECVISLTLSHDAESAANSMKWRGEYSSLGWFSWTEVTDVLSQILLLLPCLRSLAITSHKPDAFINWKHVPQDLQDILFHCFSLPSLNTLVLDRIVSMEVSPLIDCSNITNLTLIGVTLSEEDMDPIGEAEPMDIDNPEGGEVMSRGHLQSLEVGDCGASLDKLLEGFERDDARLSISGLKNLTVHASMYDDAMEKALKCLIRQAGGSIEKLRTDVPVSCDRNVNELKVLNSLRRLEDRLPHLTSLNVEVILSWCAEIHEHADRMPYSVEPLEAIIQAVRHACEARHLETVRFDIIIESYPWSRIYPAECTKLSEIATALTLSELWPFLETTFGTASRLRTLSIDIAIATPLMKGLPTEIKPVEVRKRDEVVEETYRKMPNLTKNGTLNAYWCVHFTGSFHFASGLN
ncbi:hypothetical protein NMY22_g4226 [Coprinellus aureogranulatus]|nr:hypothetical protein NMY22_g4226 [Coprinellus aureogranulatus]